MRQIGQTGYRLVTLNDSRQCMRQIGQIGYRLGTLNDSRQCIRQIGQTGHRLVTLNDSRQCIRQIGQTGYRLVTLRGAWRDHSFPEPFSWFLPQNRPWKSEDHLCMLFFIEMSKERLEKSERTPPVSLRPWALAYSRDRPYNFSCLSALSKKRRFRSFFPDLGCHLASKSLSWPAMPVSNKKQEFEQWKRIKLFDDFWVRAYRFDFAPRRRPRARSM